MLQDTARRLGSRRQDVVLALLFVMAAGQYMSAVSNIRTMIALSLVCLCLYRETVQGKRILWDIPLYMVAGLMHTMAVPAIAMRMVLPVFRRKMPAWKKMAIPVLMAALLVLVPNLAEELVEKVNDYFFGESYSYLWEYLIGILALMTELYILWDSREDLSRRGAGWMDIRWMLILCVGAAAAGCTVFSVFHRLVTYLAPILAAPLMLHILVEEPGMPCSGRIQNRRTLLAVISLCMLALTCSRGSLCSFKFF